MDGDSIIDVMEVHLISEKQSFDSCFEVFLADTPESKQIQYNLRYQVYCDEMGFEDKDKFPDQLESDEWDDSSAHFLVRHKSSGHWLGGLRLVYHKESLFPFEEWSMPYEKIASKDRQFSVEMSRLCIIKEARRFTSKRFAPYGLPDMELPENGGNVRSFYNFKNQSRSIMWGLIRAAVLYSARNDLSSWYFVVAPSLACFITKEGFDMRQIGDPCEHRGLRTPYRLSVANILANPLWQKDYKNDFRLYSELVDESTGKRRVIC